MWQVANGFDVEGGKENIFFRSPFFEMSVFVPEGSGGAVPSMDATDPASKYDLSLISDQYYIQSGAVYRSQGFEGNVFGSSSGWWAATVATYCPSRPGELPKCLSSKPYE